MNPPFEHAPDFSLPSPQGPFHLSDHNGRNRIALLFTSDDARGSTALKQVERGQSGWQERDLLLVLVVPPTSQLLTQPLQSNIVRVLSDAEGNVGRTFGIRGERRFFLLGKSDFPVALCAEEMPQDHELFALIDAMPMRKQEMKQQRAESEN